MKNYLKPVLLVVIFLIVAGCTNTEDTGIEAEESESEQNIQTVLQHMFTGPTEEQEKVINSYDGGIQKLAKTLSDYNMEHFAPYMSERFFEDYIVNANMGLWFVRLAHPDYKVKVDDIEIEEKDNYYTFTVNLSYTNNLTKETNTMVVKGNAQTNEDDHVTSIQYSSDLEDIRSALE